MSSTINLKQVSQKKKINAFLAHFTTRPIFHPGISTKISTKIASNDLKLVYSRVPCTVLPRFLLQTVNRKDAISVGISIETTALSLHGNLGPRVHISRSACVNDLMAVGLPCGRVTHLYNVNATATELSLSYFAAQLA